MGAIKYVFAVVAVAIGIVIGFSLCDIAKNSYDREEEEDWDE